MKVKGAIHQGKNSTMISLGFTAGKSTVTSQHRKFKMKFSIDRQKNHLSVRAQLFLLTLCGFLLSGCDEQKIKPIPELPSQLGEVIAAIGCKSIDHKSAFPLETRDREFYAPISFEISNIRTKEKLDGYHGPTEGRYILALETYATEAEAQKRIDEYQNLSRLAGVTRYDENDLSKMTLRCWGYRSGKQAYLLTTLGAAQFHLERRTNFIIQGVKDFSQ